MYSACEDCLSVYSAYLAACPLCHQSSAWLFNTYDIDAKPIVSTTYPSSTTTAVK